MSDWQDFELDRTIHEYSYTPRAVKKISRIIDSEEFASMDADAIFKYLSEEMEIVLFPDYLKRYIYEKTRIDIAYSKVPFEIYQDIIAGAFEDNKAPFSLHDSKVRKNTAIRGWLTQTGVNRSSIFVLGFGLKMPAEDVNMFLTKGIMEEGFDFSDPKETVFWFCYKNGLLYSNARKLLKWYEETEPEKQPDKVWESMSSAPEFFLVSLENLKKYLMMLKSRHFSENRRDTSYKEFLRLYDDCRGLIADMHNQAAEYIDGGFAVTAADITPSDLEKELCSGIPLNKNGNLEAMARSCFSGLFRNKKMSRQRITAILNRRQKVDRFDLITLLFFIYAQTVEPDWPAERFSRFIDEINQILERCRMSGIYPVNPYEAFILMCLIADTPLETYAEIWERSYWTK